MGRNPRILVPAIFTMALIVSVGVARELAQDTPAGINVFSNLIGGKWVAEGKWGSGKEFKQEIVYEWGVGNKILKSKTVGTVNQETGEVGLRSEGVRAWDKDRKVIRFWEYDVHGGITEGTVVVESGQFYFEYEYKTGDGISRLRDVWVAGDEDTYTLTIMMRQGSEWMKLMTAKVTRQL